MHGWIEYISSYEDTIYTFQHFPNLFIIILLFCLSFIFKLSSTVGEDTFNPAKGLSPFFKKSKSSTWYNIPNFVEIKIYELDSLSQNSISITPLKSNLTLIIISP